MSAPLPLSSVPSISDARLPAVYERATKALKRAIDADDVLKLIAHRPGIGYADLRELCGCGSDLISRLCKSLRDAGRVVADKKNVGGQVRTAFYTPQAWLAAQMQAERAAGFPAEKERPPPASHGHGITAEDMAWMKHYQRRYFERLERVRGLSA